MSRLEPADDVGVRLRTLVQQAAVLDAQGSFDTAVLQWSQDLTAPGDVVRAVEQVRRSVRASRRRDEVLERVALLGVDAVAQRQLRDALTDPLTGLATRSRLCDEVRHLMALADRGGRPLTAVLLDVDGLKRLNDEQGHAAGDAALAEVGRAVRAHLRRSDRAYRWGGDEFLLVLPGTLEDALVVVGRVLGSCATRFSYGVATHEGGTSDAHLEQWLAAADADLYRRRAQARGALVPRPRRGLRGRNAALAAVATAAAVAVGTVASPDLAHERTGSASRLGATDAPAAPEALLHPSPPAQLHRTRTPDKASRAARRTAVVTRRDVRPSAPPPAVRGLGVPAAPPVPAVPPLPAVPPVPPAPPQPGLVGAVLRTVTQLLPPISM